ncbi:unnamed protein product [Laminaria digitata]
MDETQLAHAAACRDNEKGAAGRTVRVLTWNINGLRKVAVDHGGLKQLLDQFNADILCFQEIKITRRDLVERGLAQAKGYHCLFTHCKVPRKASYSGVATFIRSNSGFKTLASTKSLADADFFGSYRNDAGSFSAGLNPDRLGALDSEGRVLVTDHGHFVLFNVYAPCTSSGDEDEKKDERRSFKRDFLTLLESRVSQLQDVGRAVILVGDLNACASQLDHGFTISDADFLASDWSKWIRWMLGSDSLDVPRLVDCFRRLHPNRKDAFTCWNTQTGARENNYGTRIDYITASADFANRNLRTCDIMPDFLGSDHCPVRAKFVVPLSPGEKDKSSVDSGGAGDGQTSVGGLGGDDHEWSEHPPECSCFYPELARKQAKLARYFIASGANQTPEGARGRDNGIVGENGAGSRGNNLTPCSVNDRAGKVQREAVLSQTRAGLKGPEPRGVRGNTLGPAGRSSSCAGARGRGIGSTSRLQGKLTLGSPATRSATMPAAKLRTLTPATEAEGKEAAGGVVRGLTTNCGQGQAVISSASSRAGNSSASPAEPSGSRNDTQGSGAPLDGSGEEANTLPGSARTEDRVKPNPGSSSNSKSAEAWKALFGQKKSAPLCEHGEPSIQRTVLKDGPNQNRRFYTCARSAGNWPTDRNARCKFFQFRYDGVRGFMERPPPDDSSTKKQRRT